MSDAIIAFDPTNHAWPNSYEDMMEHAKTLLDTIDGVVERLTRAVEYAEALRAAQDDPRSHSTVPTEKPRTGALNDAQRPSPTHFAAYPGCGVCMNCGRTWGQHLPDSSCTRNNTLVTGLEEG